MSNSIACRAYELWRLRDAAVDVATEIRRAPVAAEEGDDDEDDSSSSVVENQVSASASGLSPDGQRQGDSTTALSEPACVDVSVNSQLSSLSSPGQCGTY